ncbi:hypothetical protein GTA08_BOTSDO07265 [Botryosphaeria dothidea]|uniref:Uncharacterized protein n=1 Tax=Botryosphaeria dothidea TaxID=55169 RepID=A0A8H4IQI2_9PEZI|nr:hypothetical protein GTA08_BOTSDO07265 [Botryosphaeria dothidea]
MGNALDVLGFGYELTGKGIVAVVCQRLHPRRQDVGTALLADWHLVAIVLNWPAAACLAGHPYTSSGGTTVLHLIQLRDYPPALAEMVVNMQKPWLNLENITLQLEAYSFRQPTETDTRIMAVLMGPQTSANLQ